MLGTYSDEFGKLDFERSQHGSGMSNRSQAKRFVSALNSIAERTYNNLFDLQQLRHIAKELQIRVSSASSHFNNNSTLPDPSQWFIAEGGVAKTPLLCLFAATEITNLLLLGWAEFLKCLCRLHWPHSCLQQQLLALVRADSTDEAASEQDSGLICERQCWFQCFTPSGSPEDTPVFVPKFRLVVSLLYFSSAVMFLCDLLWIKYAFQVFIPASDILRLYLDRNIM